jgi:hypothetical protein
MDVWDGARPFKPLGSFGQAVFWVVMLTESSFEITGMTTVKSATTLALEYVNPKSRSKKGQG